MSLPGKGLQGHICPTIVTSWWHHLERHEHGGLIFLLHCGQGDMNS